MTDPSFAYVHYQYTHAGVHITADCLNGIRDLPQDHPKRAEWLQAMWAGRVLPDLPLPIKLLPRFAFAGFEAPDADGYRKPKWDFRHWVAFLEQCRRDGKWVIPKLYMFVMAKNHGIPTAGHGGHDVFDLVAVQVPGGPRVETININTERSQKALESYVIAFKEQVFEPFQDIIVGVITGMCSSLDSSQVAIHSHFDLHLEQDFEITRDAMLWELQMQHTHFGKALIASFSSESSTQSWYDRELVRLGINGWKNDSLPFRETRSVLRKLEQLRWEPILQIGEVTGDGQLTPNWQESHYRGDFEQMYGGNTGAALALCRQHQIVVWPMGVLHSRSSVPEYFSHYLEDGGYIGAGTYGMAQYAAFRALWAKTGDDDPGDDDPGDDDPGDDESVYDLDVSRGMISGVLAAGDDPERTTKHDGTPLDVLPVWRNPQEYPQIGRRESNELPVGTHVVLKADPPAEGLEFFGFEFSEGVPDSDLRGLDDDEVAFVMPDEAVQAGAAYRQQDEEPPDEPSDLEARVETLEAHVAELWEVIEDLLEADDDPPGEDDPQPHDAVVFIMDFQDPVDGPLALWKNIQNARAEGREILVVLERIRAGGGHPLAGQDPRQAATALWAIYAEALDVLGLDGSSIATFWWDYYALTEILRDFVDRHGYTEIVCDAPATVIKRAFPEGSDQVEVVALGGRWINQALVIGEGTQGDWNSRNDPDAFRHLLSGVFKEVTIIPTNIPGHLHLTKSEILELLPAPLRTVLEPYVEYRPTHWAMWDWSLTKEMEMKWVAQPIRDRLFVVVRMDG